MSDRSSASQGRQYDFDYPLPAGADTKARKAFVDYYIAETTKESFANPSYYWEVYSELFQNFTEEDFAELSPRAKGNLRQLLEAKGVIIIPDSQRPPPAAKVFMNAIATFPPPRPTAGPSRAPGDAVPIGAPMTPATGTAGPSAEPPAPARSPEAVPPPHQIHLAPHAHFSEPGPPYPSRGRSQTAPRAPPSPEGSSQDLQRRTIALARLCSAEDKYSGEDDDDFETKLKVFASNCQIAGMNDTMEMAKVFQFMLKGRALRFYLDDCQWQNCDAETVERRIRQRFYTEERLHAFIREWDRLSLASRIKENPNKTVSQNFKEMVARMEKIQPFLTDRHSGDAAFREKLFNASMGVPACGAGRFHASGTASGLISDLQNAIADWEVIHADNPPGGVTALHTDTENNYVDRRYGSRGGRQPSRQGSRSPRPPPRTPYFAASSSRSTPQGRQPKRCFVCGREGCWSTNHPPKEREGRIRQYIADVEGEPEGGGESPGQVVVFEGDEETSNDRENEESPSAAYFAYMADSAVFHALTGTPERIARHRDVVFNGLLVDTGANKLSTAGKAQYDAYCALTGRGAPLTPSSATCAFGMGATEALGAALVSFPVGDLVLKTSFHVVDADTPFLLCLADMDRLGLVYDNLEDRLIHAASGNSAPITRVNGHPFLQWSPITQCLLTETEIRRLHKRFGHPHADKLYHLLRRAEVDVPPELRKALDDISGACEACQRNAQAPRRFKFALKDEREFNQTIYVDVCYLNGRPALHVVDEATNYQAARWLPAVSATAIWQALRLCWIDVYIGPPDVIAHDAGKGFVAGEFQASADMLHIATKPIPVESPQSMSAVERYHGPLRRAYNIVSAESPNGTDSALLLQAAVKAVNDSVGPDGLIPTLLVYGAIPRLGLPNDLPAPATFKRAAAVRKATNELSKASAKARVSEALRTRNGPIPPDLTPGMQVLVWRRNTQIPKGRWEGPYGLASVEGETCNVILPSGVTAFRSSVVRRFQQGEEMPPPPEAEDDGMAYFCLAGSEAFLRDIVTDDPRRFEEARNMEIQGLLARGTFVIVPSADAVGHRVYGGRFVDEVKNAGTLQAYEKSRFVVQAYNDRDHGLLTHAPTVHRASQRLCVALCAQDPSFRLFSRDVSQAYLQSETTIQRPIYVRPPPEIGLPEGRLFRVARPLYGIPEAGMHWFSTYHKHHVQALGMTPTAYDPCLLFTPGLLSNSKSGPRGVTCLQTDDTANAGNEEFIRLEEANSARFQCKKAEILTADAPLRFNGATIELRRNGDIFMHQAEQISRLQEVKKDDKEEYVAQRARGAYIASVCAPTLSYGFSAAAQQQDPDGKAVDFLNRHIRRCEGENGLLFKRLKRPFHLAVFVDAAFANNKDHSSQLGFIIALMDDTSAANIIHYSSQKSKRITRSALAAELYAMMNGFDTAAALKVAIDGMLGTGEKDGAGVPMVIYTDSRSLYDALVSLNTTTEKRLLIDLHLLRQAYERREVAEVLWIPTGQNPADALTKERATPGLQRLLEGRLRLTPNAWVNRGGGGHSVSSFVATARVWAK